MLLLHLQFRLIMHLISDRYLISLTMSFNSTHTIITSHWTTYNCSKADYDGLQQFLFNSSYYNSNDVNEAWLIIKHVILSGINQFIPKVRLRPVQYPVWFKTWDHCPQSWSIIPFQLNLINKRQTYSTTFFFQYLQNVLVAYLSCLSLTAYYLI